MYEIRSNTIKKILNKKKEKKENFILPRSKLNLVSALSHATNAIRPNKLQSFVECNAHL